MLILCLVRGLCLFAAQLPICLLSPNEQAVAAQERTESDLKAAYLFNFAKFTHWSKESTAFSDKSITLCVLAAPLIADSLKAAESRKIGDSSLRVVSLSSINARGQCNLIYLSPNSDAPTGIIETLLSEGLLVVSDPPRRGVISFVKIGGKLSFSVNLNHADKAKVRLSSDLLSLATAVEGGASN